MSKTMFTTRLDEDTIRKLSELSKVYGTQVAVITSSINHEYEKQFKKIKKVDTIEKSTAFRKSIGFSEQESGWINTACKLSGITNIKSLFIWLVFKYLSTADKED